MNRTFFKTQTAFYQYSKQCVAFVLLTSLLSPSLAFAVPGSNASETSGYSDDGPSANSNYSDYSPTSESYSDSGPGGKGSNDTGSGTGGEGSSSGSDGSSYGVSSPGYDFGAGDGWGSWSGPSYSYEKSSYTDISPYTPSYAYDSNNDPRGVDLGNTSNNSSYAFDAQSIVDAISKNTQTSDVLPSISGSPEITAANVFDRMGVDKTETGSINPTKETETTDIAAAYAEYGKTRQQASDENKYTRVDDNTYTTFVDGQVRTVEAVDVPGSTVANNLANQLSQEGGSEVISINNSNETITSVDLNSGSVVTYDSDGVELSSADIINNALSDSWAVPGGTVSNKIVETGGNYITKGANLYQRNDDGTYTNGLGDTFNASDVKNSDIAETVAKQAAEVGKNTTIVVNTQLNQTTVVDNDTNKSYTVDSKTGDEVDDPQEWNDYIDSFNDSRNISSSAVDGKAISDMVNEWADSLPESALPEAIGSTETTAVSTLSLLGTAAVAAALGMSNLSTEDKQALALALAGEIHSKTLADLKSKGYNGLTNEQKKEFTQVINVIINEAAKNNKTIAQQVNKQAYISSVTVDKRAYSNIQGLENELAEVVDKATNGTMANEDGLSTAVPAATANHYTATYSHPSWKSALENTVTIGLHIAGNIASEFNPNKNNTDTYSVSTVTVTPVDESKPTEVVSVTTNENTNEVNTTEVTSVDQSKTKTVVDGVVTNGTKSAFGTAVDTAKGVFDQVKSFVNNVLNLNFTGGTPPDTTSGDGDTATSTLENAIPMQSASVITAVVAQTMINSVVNYLHSLFGTSDTNVVESSFTKLVTETVYVPVTVYIDVTNRSVLLAREDLIAKMSDPANLTEEFKQTTAYKAMLSDDSDIIFSDNGEIFYSNGLYAPRIENGQLIDENSNVKYVYTEVYVDENGNPISASSNSDIIPSGLFSGFVNSIIKDTRSFTLDDIEDVYVVNRSNNGAASGDYYDYIIVLKDGSIRAVTLPRYTNVSYMEEVFGDVGFDGSVAAIVSLATPSDSSEFRGSSYASALLSYGTDKVNSLLGSSDSESVTDFTDLSGSSVSKAAFPDYELNKVFIYQNALVSCTPANSNNTGYAYMAVLTKNDDSQKIITITEAACGAGDILSETTNTATRLREVYGVGINYEDIINISYLKTDVFVPEVGIRNIDLSESAIEDVTDFSSLPTDTEEEKLPNTTNAISLEVKATNSSDGIVSDWSSQASIAISSGDNLYFRWDATDYTQCLAYLGDAGSYALSRIQSPTMLSGNTETEGYNVPEKSGSYRIECSGQRNNEGGVDMKSVEVTVN